jgi:peptide/nickel transport system ATP-binding protein
MTGPVLAMQDVVRTFGGGTSWFGRRKPQVRAVDGVSLAVAPARTLGIVGESGCGKSTLARMMVGLLLPSEGTVRIDADDVAVLARRDRRRLHRKVQMVFQDPLGALNPRKTVQQILEAPLRALHGLGPRARRQRVVELMALVSLRAEFAGRYPHEFSGGQAQRIGIARALAAEASVLVLDEPVSSLDVSVQAQVLTLLADLQARLGLTYVFISHDLAVVEAVADEVAVMYFGKVVEQGPRARIFAQPEHEYTRLLLASVPGARRAWAHA